MYIKVYDVVLNTVKKAKLLDVTIDESLTCLEHIEFLRQKACSKLRNFLDCKNGQAARIILNVKTTQTSSVDINRVLNLMSIQDYFTYSRLLLAFKILKGMIPE